MDLPPGKRALISKWVYKVKYLLSGDIERYKARLVARGYNQAFGLDYCDFFSPVAKTATVRTFLAIGASKQWQIHQVDVNNAYLHGHIEEEIYLQPPEGYHKAKAGKVCKQFKSLYGLKQAGRQWHKEISDKLLSFGFQISQGDHCLFTKGSGSNFLALVVYVGDILIVGPNTHLIDAVKKHLHSLFTIKDMGLEKYFLGVGIAQTAEGIFLSQVKYANDLVMDAGLENSSAATNPFDIRNNLATQGVPLEDSEPYRRLVGRLLYLNFTRADISYCSQQLSQYMQSPCYHHMQAALKVLRYLKGTTTHGLFYPKSTSLQLFGYCDSDWGGCKITRRPLTSFANFLANLLFPGKPRNNK